MCGGADSAPAVVAPAVLHADLPEHGHQRELPPCVVPRSPRDPPLCPRFKVPRGPGPQSPTLRWCRGHAVCWGQQLSRPCMCRCWEERVSGGLLGLIPAPELAQPCSQHPGHGEVRGERNGALRAARPCRHGCVHCWQLACVLVPVVGAEWRMCRSHTHAATSVSERRQEPVPGQSRSGVGAVPGARMVPHSAPAVSQLEMHCQAQAGT